MAEKPKVAILGGRVGALTTAFELSRPGWRDRFDSITVYQLGWRLGGKGASGRGAHDRIEEHGLHIWLGFYENAFRIMRECYEELGRAQGEPLATIDEAFEKASFVIAEEMTSHGWAHWLASFPEDDEVPGTATELPTLWDYLRRALELASEFLASIVRRAAPATGGRVTLAPVASRARPAPAVRLRQAGGSRWSSAAVRVTSALNALVRGVDRPLDAALATAIELVELMGADPDRRTKVEQDWLLELVERAMAAAKTLVRGLAMQQDETRRSWYLVDILLACVRGVLDHDVPFHPDGFGALDEFDFAEWLVLNGADEESARSGVVTAVVYDLPFAYRNGDPTQPSCSAGVALRGFTRIFFTYKGAIMWKMRAGMGDVVFAPLYQVLSRRGVRFEFFHRVDRLRLSPDGRTIAAIEVGRQVELLDPATEYQPLRPVEGLPCWPSEPLYEQVRDGDRLKGHNLESFWVSWPDAGSRTLRAGEDFDLVVLGIGLGALPFICQELIDDDPAWARMVEHLATVNTQAFQLWLSATMEELGCPWPQATTGGYLEPFDTYADMRQLIERESWETNEVRAIAYFCNVLPTPPGPPDPHDRDTPVRATAEVKANALRFLRDEMAHLWPRGVHRYPTDFRWDLLAGAGDAQGPARFDSQYWRANVDPSDRYVLSLPGTAKHRLDPGGSGYDNLYLAGDWTECGLDAGCVEAAVISGRVAAHAIQGSPRLDQILGYRHV